MHKAQQGSEQNVDFCVGLRQYKGANAIVTDMATRGDLITDKSMDSVHLVTHPF